MQKFPDLITFRSSKLKAFFSWWAAFSTSSAESWEKAGVLSDLSSQGFVGKCFCSFSGSSLSSLAFSVSSGCTLLTGNEIATTPQGLATQTTAHLKFGTHLIPQFTFFGFSLVSWALLAYLASIICFSELNILVRNPWYCAIAVSKCWFVNSFCLQ